MGHPSGVKVGAVEIGPVVATGGGADETPVAAPGRSISGWYPHATRETARATSRTGRCTAGRYGFRSARGSGRSGRERAVRIEPVPSRRRDRPGPRRGSSSRARRPHGRRPRTAARNPGDRLDRPVASGADRPVLYGGAVAARQDGFGKPALSLGLLVERPPRVSGRVVELAARLRSERGTVGVQRSHELGVVCSPG